MRPGVYGGGLGGRFSVTLHRLLHTARYMKRFLQVGRKGQQELKILKQTLSESSRKIHGVDNLICDDLIYPEHGTTWKSGSTEDLVLGKMAFSRKNLRRTCWF